MFSLPIFVSLGTAGFQLADPGTVEIGVGR